MKPQIFYEKNIPKYLLISVALVQSEICWIYSALYCVFRESGLLAPEQSAMTILARHRAHSAPPRPAHTVFTNDDFVKLDQSETERRSSLPTPIVNYRQRPNVHDERKGTTCPPLWWQKTRVKLGRAPVHGDPKPKSIGGSVSPSANDASSDSSNGVSPAPTPRALVYPAPTPSPALSITLSNQSSVSFETIEEQPEDIDLSRQVSENSVVSISSQHKKKFMAKLNSALHNIHHRRVGSNDSVKK
jgi:hypothetical protein